MARHLSKLQPFGRRERSSLFFCVALLLLAGCLISSSCGWLFLAAPHEPMLAGVDRRSAVLGASIAYGVAGSTLLSPGATLAAAGTVTDARIPGFKLANGETIPTMALNTAGLSADAAEAATRQAVSLGVKHIDFHPGIERDGVARVLKEKGRDALFLTTKIRKYKDEPADPAAAAARATSQIADDFAVLGVKNVDVLLLRDSPSCKVMQAQWSVLEEALASGKARSIGVINYCEKALSCLLETASVTPTVNYFMLHAGMGPNAHGLRSFGEQRGIKTFAYGPLGEPGPAEELLQSPLLRRIGDAHNRSPAQVALRWVAQTGAALSVRPTAAFGLGKSVCEGPECRMGLVERVQTFDWKLAPQEMSEIDAMTSPDGNPTLFSSPGCKGCFGCA